MKVSEVLVQRTVGEGEVMGAWITEVRTGEDGRWY
jgi:hypothetical protein